MPFAFNSLAFAVTARVADGLIFWTRFERMLDIYGGGELV
jgi:hypothetical protein